MPEPPLRRQKRRDVTRREFQADPQDPHVGRMLSHLWRQNHWRRQLSPEKTLDAAGLPHRLPQPGHPCGRAHQPLLPRRAGEESPGGPQDPGLPGAGAAGGAGPAGEPGHDPGHPRVLRLERRGAYPDGYGALRAGLPAGGDLLAPPGGAPGDLHERPGPLPQRLPLQGHGGELGPAPGGPLPHDVRAPGPDHGGPPRRPGALGGRYQCMRPGHPGGRL